MKIPNGGGQVDPRAYNLMENVQRSAEAARAIGERDGFDSRGVYSDGNSSRSEHLLASFRWSRRDRVKVDPATREIVSYDSHSKGGRRSCWVGDDRHDVRKTLQREDGDLVYTHKVKNLGPEGAEGYTEVARVSPEGTVSYRFREHLGAKVENYLRENPYTRMLLGQVLGGSVGGLAGFALALHTGEPTTELAVAGATVGACMLGGLARGRAGEQIGNLGDFLAFLPANLIQMATGLCTTAGVLLTALAVFP